MKDVAVGVVLIGVLCLVVFGVMYAASMFSSAATPTLLYSPKPGISCASMVTVNGVALSCWKD